MGSPRQLVSHVAWRPWALLQGAEVYPPVLIRNDDFAVQECARRQGAGRLHQLGKPGRQIAQVSTKHLNSRVLCVPRKSAEAVKLWLIAPVFANWKALERSGHGRERQWQHGGRWVNNRGRSRIGRSQRDGLPCGTP
jgi:hypothetical protein